MSNSFEKPPFEVGGAGSEFAGVHQNLPEFYDAKNAHDPSNQYWKNCINSLFQAYRENPNQYKISPEQVRSIQEQLENGWITPMWAKDLFLKENSDAWKKQESIEPKPKELEYPL